MYKNVQIKLNVYFAFRLLLLENRYYQTTILYIIIFFNEKCSSDCDKDYNARHWALVLTYSKRIEKEYLSGYSSGTHCHSLVHIPQVSRLSEAIQLLLQWKLLVRSLDLFV